MKDLIYWCPEEEADDDKESDASSTISVVAPGKRRPPKRPASSTAMMPPPSSVPPEKREKMEQKLLNAPQVKVNPDGSITIDESSLIVDRRDQGTDTDHDLETIDESANRSRSGGPRITSMSFRRRAPIPRGKQWSKFETDKFYRVLAFTGLDFALMHELFPTRSRIEIKRKYKRECNDDPARMDRALTSNIGRHGPWMELKKMMIERGGHCDRDERGRELLESAKDMIEDEDGRILLAAGKVKPSVAEATKIAGQLSKRGFGARSKFAADDEDVSPEQLEQMATKIIQELSEKERLESEQRREALDRRRRRYHVKTRVSGVPASSSSPSTTSPPETSNAASNDISSVF